MTTSGSQFTSFGRYSLPNQPEFLQHIASLDKAQQRRAGADAELTSAIAISLFFGSVLLSRLVQRGDPAAWVIGGGLGIINLVALTRFFSQAHRIDRRDLKDRSSVLGDPRTRLVRTLLKMQDDWNELALHCEELHVGVFHEKIEQQVFDESKRVLLELESTIDHEALFLGDLFKVRPLGTMQKIEGLDEIVERLETTRKEINEQREASNARLKTMLEMRPYTVR